MNNIEEQIVNHLVAWDEQRAGIERFAEMIAAYYQVLTDSSIISEELAKLLVLQYQAMLLAPIREEMNKGGK